MLAESSWRYDKQLNTDGVIYAIYPPEMPQDWTWAHPYGCLTSRHSGGGNIAFCDGHGEYLDRRTLHSQGVYMPLQ